MKNDEYLKYIGKICPYCKTEFVEGDEIVLCSDCEMPHHKECFIENKGCTTFGCQGSMRSIVIISEPLINVEVIEDDIKKETNNIEKFENENINGNNETNFKEKITERIYEELIDKMTQISEYSNNINDLIIISKIIIEFERIIDYFDVPKKLEIAKEKRENIANYLMDTTKVQIECTDKISLIRIGLRRYEKIRDIANKDIDEYKKLALRKIEIIEKENEIKRIEEEKQQLMREQTLELEKNKLKVRKKKKTFLGVLVIFVIILILISGFFIHKYFTLTINYNQGLKYLNDEKYGDAKNEFDRCGNFSKSKYYSEYCERMLHYLKGKDYIEVQNFEKAILEFEKAENVEDSQEYINYCKEKLKGGDY